MAAEGMRWHYDINGAEPIIRDIRVYNSGALLKGTVMCAGPVSTGNNDGCMIVADSNVLSNIIGVLQEDLSAANCLGVIATGVDFYGKCIINPGAIWLGKYSEHADDDNENTVASATGVLLTATMVTNHYRSWAYITDTGSSTGGFGNLFQVGAISGTASITAATSFAANMAASTTSDTFIVMPAPYGADTAGYGFDLSEATGQISMQLQGYSGTGTGAMMLIENYITSSLRPLEPLVTAQHSGNNYKGEDPKFYGDVWFPEHLHATGGTACDRVIT